MNDRNFLALSGLIVTGAFLLRVYQIGQQEVWLDEAFSFLAATTTDLEGLLLTETNPPLYYLLLRAWVTLAGTSEAALRMPSAIFGSLFVAAVIWAGAALLDRYVGLWAGAFAAVSPIHIYYSQEARTYSLLTLLITVAVIVLWRALSTRTWRSWCLATLAALLALYAHYFAVLALLPATWLVFLSGERTRGTDQRSRLPWLLVWLGVLLAISWLWWSVLPMKAPAGRNWVSTGLNMNWLSEAWENTPPALAIPKTLELFTLGGQSGYLPQPAKIFPHIVFPMSFRVLGLGMLALLGIWVAIPFMDKNLNVDRLQQRKLWLWGMLLFPLIAMWVVSLIHPVYVAGRYDLVAFPAFTLLVGLAFAKLQKVGRAGAILAASAGLLFFLPIAGKLVKYYEVPTQGISNWPSARLTAESLDRSVYTGDVVVFTELRGLPIVYYLDRQGYVWNGRQCTQASTGRQFGCRMFPVETERTPGIYRPARVLEHPSAIRDDVQDFLLDLSSSDSVLWVVFSRSTFAQGRLVLPDPDRSLSNALTDGGFGFLAEMNTTLGIFPYGR